MNALMSRFVGDETRHDDSRVEPYARRRSWRPGAVFALLAVVVVAAVAPAPAQAATPAPVWQITAVSAPTAFSSADAASACGSFCDQVQVRLVNVGGAPTDGSTITVTDTLPAGLTVGAKLFSPGATDGSAYWNCSTASQVVTCTSSAMVGALAQVPPIAVPVQVGSVAPDSVLTNSVTVSGGGVPEASATDAITVNPSGATPFGIASFSSHVADDAGAADTQAADHPNSLTTTFDFNTVFRGPSSSPGFASVPAQYPKDIVVDLPVGLIGDPQALPSCPQRLLVGNTVTSACPANTQVGVITWRGETGYNESFPIYNLVPDRGYPAEFGFVYEGLSVVMYASVRTGADYGLRITIPGVPVAANFQDAEVTFFGNPAAADGLSSTGTPFFTNPSDCNGQPLVTTIHADSWENPAPVPLNPDGSPDLNAANFSDPQWQTATSTSPPVTDCDALQFNPTISLQPDTTAPDAPSGLSVDLKVPQSDEPNTLATPDLRDATVTLPMGMSISPSAADGLQGCSDAQIALSSPDPGSCPLASQIGTATLHTPLLPNSLPGEIYLGTPLCSPCTNADAQDGRMLRLFIQIDDPVTGVVVKLPGTVSANPSTGQLTASFPNNPQLPFDDLQLRFKGGPRGVLSTPPTCGTFTSTADLSPWSAPSTPDAQLQDSFTISGCGNPDQFSPSFTAGTQNAQAGAYSPFVLSISRTDSDQTFSGLTTKLPPGMLAKLAGVPLCSDSDATAGTCPASTQVGTVTTGAGPGSEPFFLSGQAYLTGPYKGAPYGLAVVVPAIAGPFNLGTVVVRQALDVNPTTAQVTDLSDPFPTMLDGIPLQIRRIDVDLNRPDFTVNPTSCDPMAINATLTSTGGMTDNVSSRFQVGGCQDIGFSPKLKIGLSGKGQTKSGDHPTLTATLTDRSGQANLRSAKVTLPLSMALDPNNSSHVCNYGVAAAVHGGAVGCPTKTIVGTATAVTPLLSQPLTGKVYLVQGLRCAKGSISAQGTCVDGKTAIHTLPSLLVPLRGQIALDLRAKSSVNGAGALVTTFSTIPDAPVSKFTLQISGGKKGLLVVTGRGQSICGKPQVAGESLGAQSGKSMVADDTLTTPCAGVKHKTRQHGSRDTTKSRRAGLVVGRRLS